LAGSSIGSGSFSPSSSSPRFDLAHEMATIRRARVDEAAEEQMDLSEAGLEIAHHVESADRPDREPWESLRFVPGTIRYSLYDVEAHSSRVSR
jgi:hypothetical protein